MAWRDEARRWIKDKIARDEEIKLRPKEAIADVAAHIDRMSAAERNQRLEHLKAYMTVYYQGRHNEKTPQDVQQQLKVLSERMERLKDVDRDRLVLARFGGAPTRETTQEAIHRSALEREKQLAPQQLQPVNERRKEVGSQRQVLGQRGHVQEQPAISSQPSSNNRSVENSPAPVQYVEWLQPEQVGASQASVANTVRQAPDTSVETRSVQADLGVSVWN